MMNFEDIVDMEWFDSHTAPIDTSFLPPSPPMTTADDNVMLSLPSGTTAMDLLAYQHKAGKEISMMALPPIDQIKQLIEVAKKELAFREQMLVSHMEFVPTENISNTVSPESLIKSTPGQDAQMERDEEEEEEEEESGPPSPSSLSSSSEQPMTLEAYAKTDGIDIRNLSSKERRQLRNKISARNFRIRRKEYITTLEGQVSDQKKKTEELMHRLNIVEEENEQLKLQIDSLKHQNHQLMNKDISMLGSKSTDTYRQDTSILVS